MDHLPFPDEVAITRLDLFAAAALHSMLTTARYNDPEFNDWLAPMAWKWAQAMEAARLK